MKAVSLEESGVAGVVGPVMVVREDRMWSASVGPEAERRAARAEGVLVGSAGLVVGGGGALVVDGSVVGVELARDHFRRLDRFGSIVC